MFFLEIDTDSVASHNNKSVKYAIHNFHLLSPPKKLFRISRISGKTYFIEEHYFSLLFVLEQGSYPDPDRIREKTTSK